ncbi:MAG: exodeoxyribonuclease VII large subunit, partial [Thermotogota bacterium]|nr:exodeoxyribonuclease VII large subunit [Thermotogota bacterium]
SELEKISLLIQRKKVERETELNQTIKLINRLDPVKVISNGLININTQLERISNVIRNKTKEKANQLMYFKKSLQKPTTSLKFKKTETELVVNLEKIRSNDPNRYLKKGYSRIEKDGITVNSVVQLKTGDSVQIFLKDGKARSEIQELIKKR